MDNVEAARIMVQGMSADQMIVTALASIALFVLIISITISITVFLNKQMMLRINSLLDPLKDIPVILATLQSKVKSGEQLEKMIDDKIKYHELTLHFKKENDNEKNPI